ncbi:MAG: hypothetical protein A2X97_14095 [Bdellovibrionales bacterium GWA1_52_35]|nr:MAG: hypothetical protein A2X97_14095 [Bdellovibrionales bacterium GWA1_52_35]
MTPERRIQKAIMAYLWAVGIFSWTNASTGTFDPTRKVFRSNKDKYKIKGTSDILGILPDGRLLAIEVKSETGRLTPEQKEFIGSINRRGGLAFMARSVDDAKASLAPWVKNVTPNQPSQSSQVLEGV